jgi:hypothetical protein
METVEQVKKYKKLLKACEKARLNLKEFEVSLVGNCEHPDEFCHIRDEDADDGYGHWWKNTIKTCVCGERWIKYVKEWSRIEPVWPTKVQSE